MARWTGGMESSRGLSRGDGSTFRKAKIPKEVPRDNPSEASSSSDLTSRRLDGPETSNGDRGGVGSSAGGRSGLITASAMESLYRYFQGKGKFSPESEEITPGPSI